MARYYICNANKTLDVSKIVFVRNEMNRPIAKYPEDFELQDFNISHSGDYVSLIIACTTFLKVGIDVMKLEKPVNIKWNEFKAPFLDMISPSELNWIESNHSVYKCGEKQDESIFNRFYIVWVLKESVSKAIGVGLNLMSKVSFTFSLVKNRSDSSIKVLEDSYCIQFWIQSVLDKDWYFLVDWVDQSHIFAVAINRSSCDVDKKIINCSKIFHPN